MQTSPRILITLLLVGLSMPSTVFAQSVTGPQQWLVDYSYARQEAKRLGLPLLIHFSATWCGPCKQMERDTLHSPALLSTLGSQVLALKIDSDEDPGLTEAFRVKALPTDIIVAPDGKIVSRTTNYQNRDDYVANIKHWSAQFSEVRAAALARLASPSPPQKPVASTRPLPPTQQAPVVAEPQKVVAEPKRTDNIPVIVQRPEPTVVSSPRLVGLTGYSPVAIKTRRVWVKGQEDLAVTWQGVVYYLANDREYLAFKNEPHRYAPRMLGCDPVLLWSTDRAVQGVVEYGAFYDGDLFLFTTSETRDQFKVNPDQFVRVRHVLNPDEVIGTRIR
ncbi:MAG: thioredoxin family protein [Rhodopirellula sp.]|nr:thioredoxin family protein [Rhodopirellula sp.]